MQKIGRIILAMLAMLAAPLSVHAGVAANTLKRAYLDRLQRVHVVGADKRDHIVDKRPARDLMMAPDHRSVAWAATFKHEGLVLSDEIRIYRPGHMRRLPCGPASTSFAYRDGGRQLAVRCAGLHFAGSQELYDIRTFQRLASFQEADVPFEQRPSWNIDAD
jgi:hypothetical protein